MIKKIILDKSYILICFVFFAFCSSCSNFEQSSEQENFSYMVSLNDDFDFDNDGTSDIKFQKTTGSGGDFYLLTPLNGSGADLTANFEEEGLHCESYAADIRPTHVNGFTRGDRVCVVTSKGNFFDIEILELNIEVEFVQFELISR